MDAQRLARIVGQALEPIDIPRALDNWRDDIEGAASLGVARMLAKDEHAAEPELIAAARNAARDEIRDEQRRRGATITRDGEILTPAPSFEPMPDDVAQDVGGEDDPPSSLITSDLLMRARERLAHLPKRQRDVLDARYIDGLTQAQAARRLGETQRDVSRLEARALAALRDAMADERDTPAHATTATRTRVAGVPSRSQQGHTPSHTKAGSRDVTTP